MADASNLDKMFLLRNNVKAGKKRVGFDVRVQKEIKKLPRQVKKEIFGAVDVLAREGRLVEPYSKKIGTNLFEIRIRYHTHWRILYAYLGQDRMVILSVFLKKSQRTPKKEIDKAKDRLRKFHYESHQA